MTLRFIVCLALSTLPVMAQDKPIDLVLDRSKPWAYLRLDHAGPSKSAAGSKEVAKIWLRLVNNCRLPITIHANGGDLGEPGIGVHYFVVADHQDGIIVSSYSVPLWPNEEPSEPKMPVVLHPDVFSVVTIDPGDDVLFSVPREHVSKNWNIRVLFKLAVDTRYREPLNGPVSYVEFTYYDLPEGMRDR